ncbi:MAG: diguanylate cyclase [Clostridiales bacterium]|nr:diguanylate cyclase [Clostridiales bacterium]
MNILTNYGIFLLDAFVPYPMAVYNPQKLFYHNRLFYELNIDENYMLTYAKRQQAQKKEKSVLGIFTKSKEKKFFEISTVPVSIEGETYYLSFLVDITEKKKKEQMLRKMSIMKEAFLEISNSIMSVGNFDELLDNILEYTLKAIDKAVIGSFFVADNDVFRLASYRGFGEEVKNYSFPIKDSFIYAATEGRMDKIVNSGDYDNIEINYPAKSIDGIAIQATISVPITADESFLGIINIDSTIKNAFDNDDLKYMEFVKNNIELALSNYLSEKASLSKFDSLTNIHNIDYIQEQFKSIKREALRNGEKFYLVIIDVDRLKRINNNFGHMAGDKIILRISSELSQITSNKDLLVRYRGDSFIGLFFNKNKEQLRRSLDGVKHNLNREPVFINSTMIVPSFTYGFAYFPEDGLDLDTLINAAKQQMNIKKLAYPQADSV